MNWILGFFIPFSFIGIALYSLLFWPIVEALAQRYWIGLFIWMIGWNLIAGVSVLLK